MDPNQLNLVAQSTIYQPESLALLSMKKIRQASELDGFELINWWLKDKTFLFYLKYLLQCRGNDLLKVEALWTINNISAESDTLTSMLIDNGFMQVSLQLLASHIDDVVEHAIATLGNFIYENVNNRDIAIKLGIVEKLSAIELGGKSFWFFQTLASTVSNLIRCQSAPISMQQVEKLMPILRKIIEDGKIEATIDALKALCFISKANEDHIQLVISSGILFIIPIISNNLVYERVLVGVLALLINLASGKQEHRKALIDNGLLFHIRFTLMHGVSKVRHMALMCVANLAAGGENDIDDILDSGVMREVIHALKHRESIVRKEALYILHNIMVKGSKDQLEEIVNMKPASFIDSISLTGSLAPLTHNVLQQLFSKVPEMKETHSEIYTKVMSTTS